MRGMFRSLNQAVTLLTKKFIICTEGITRAQELAIRDNIATLGNWWHWIEGMWLLVAEDEALDSTKILRQLVGDTVDIRLFVQEVKDLGMWAGVGPTQSPNDMFEWIAEYWQE